MVPGGVLRPGYRGAGLVGWFVYVALGLVALCPQGGSSQDRGRAAQPFEYRGIAWSASRSQVLRELRSEGLQARAGDTASETSTFTGALNGVRLRVVATFGPSKTPVRIEETFGPVSNAGFLAGLRSGLERRFGSPAQKTATRVTWRRTGHAWVSDLVLTDDGAGSMTLTYTPPSSTDSAGPGNRKPR